MKKIVEVENGFEALLGETVLLMCSNYFYHGKVSGVSDDVVELTDAGIVYETGPWDKDGFADRQALPGSVCVRIDFIESYQKS